MSNVYSICPSSTDTDRNDALERYETMPVGDVVAELRDAGIDPTPTVAAVEKIIRKYRERLQQVTTVQAVDP